jgi:ribosomal protein S18 acetylase RimI-like enzyme
VSEKIGLRRAGPADAFAIRDLTRAAYARWVPVIGREPKPMQADYETAVRTHRFDLLYVDENLAGLIETIDEGEILLIENVAVAPDFQGRRLGHILMTHAETIARDLGLPRLRLFTNQRMAANVRLYLALGYAIDREEPISDGFAVHMSKVI